MTVNELIAELQNLSGRGFGDAKVVRHSPGQGIRQVQSPGAMHGFVEDPPGNFDWLPDAPPGVQSVLVFVE